MVVVVRAGYLEEASLLLAVVPDNLLHDLRLEIAERNLHGLVTPVCMEYDAVAVCGELAT